MKKRSSKPIRETTRTVRARVVDGNLALLDPLNLPNGSKVDVTVTPRPEPDGSVAGSNADLIRSTSGAWADLLDCEELERAVYERRHRHRTPVRL